jgi:N-hydroxyarylamine O-acetyltransferase
VKVVFDLDAYLDRIGLAGHPTIAAVHRAHVAAIPFENLDPHRGLGVSLELEEIQRKLVVGRRGGYCFEHNLLLKAALEALGADVEPMLARVRLGASEVVRAPTHLVLRVSADGERWLADVGFGRGALLEPTPFAVDAESEQSGWRFRLVEEAHELVLLRASDDGWEALYGFVPRAAPSVDIEMSNWFTATHPQSAFVTGLIVSRQVGEDGSRVTLSDWGELGVVVDTPDGCEVTPLERADIPRVLEVRFGLGGFALDADGRIVRDERA